MDAWQNGQQSMYYIFSSSSYGPLFFKEYERARERIPIESGLALQKSSVHGTLCIRIMHILCG